MTTEAVLASNARTVADERPIFHEEFGRFMRVVRERSGMVSQNGAADRAHRLGLNAVSRQKILKLETGKIKHPDPELLRQLAILYKADYSQLVSEFVDKNYRLAQRGSSVLVREVPADFQPDVLKTIPPEALEVVELWQALSDDERRTVVLLMRQLVETRAKALQPPKAAG